MIPAIDLLPPCLWKVKWVKWVKWSEWKWCIKGPLFFLKLIYIIYHVYTYNPICIKIVRQLSYRFKSLQTFGDPTKKNQNHHFYMIFSKMVLKVSILHKRFLGKISKFDGIIFQGISFENWHWNSKFSVFHKFLIWFLKGFLLYFFGGEAANPL